jgi:HK97 family phage major capsid protein
MPAIHRRESLHFSIGSVIATRLAGGELRGIEGELCRELEHRSYGPVHGDVRIPAGVFQRRDLSTNVGSGAALSPEAWLQDLLDDVAAARRGGNLTSKPSFTIVSTMRETIHVPKWTQALQADTIAKDADAASSDTTFVPDDLMPKYVSVTTTLRRSSIRYSDPAADTIITQDIRRAIDDRTDIALLFGIGGALDPIGLLTAPPPALVIDNAGDSVAAADLFALKSLMTTAWKLDDALGSLRWCTDPTVVDTLRTTSKKATAAPLSEWFSGVMPFNTADGTLLDIMVVQSGRIAPNADATHTINLAMARWAWWPTSAVRQSIC